MNAKLQRVTTMCLMLTMISSCSCSSSSSSSLSLSLLSKNRVLSSVLATTTSFSSFSAAAAAAAALQNRKRRITSFVTFTSTTTKTTTTSDNNISKNQNSNNNKSFTKQKSLYFSLGSSCNSSSSNNKSMRLFTTALNNNNNHHHHHEEEEEKEEERMVVVPPSLEDSYKDERPFDDYYDTLSLDVMMQDSSEPKHDDEEVPSFIITSSNSPLKKEEKEEEKPNKNDLQTKYQSILENTFTSTTKEEDDTNPMTTNKKNNIPPDFLSKSSNGQGYTSKLQHLQTQLSSLSFQIYKLNSGQTFNINSPKQVALLLHGPLVEGQQQQQQQQDRSTSKEVLEALAASSSSNTARLAQLILQWRQLKSIITREEKRMEARENGMEVTSSSLHSSSYSSTSTTTSTTSFTNTTQRTKREDKENTLLLADASSYIFRAYYSMPPLHRSSDGTPVGAVLGFCNMLHKLVLTKLLNGQRPRLVLVFDAQSPDDAEEEDKKTFRHELYSQYKANRKSCPIDLIPQFDLVKEAAVAYGIPTVECVGYEADDVIATMVKQVLLEEEEEEEKKGGGGLEGVNVLSGDKDLMQLVTTPDTQPFVHLIEPLHMIRISHDEVLNKWNVPPSKLGDVLALAGDASDNIPGVPGIGPKIAASLINEYDCLENLLENAGEIKQTKRREKILENVDVARLSRKLVQLESSIPLESIQMTSPSTTLSTFESMSDLRTEKIDPQRLLDFYDKMGFWDMKRRVVERMVQKGLLEDDSDGRRRGLMKESSRAMETGRGSGDEESSSSSSFSRLIINKSKRASPPKPEEFDDIPF